MTRAWMSVAVVCACACACAPPSRAATDVLLAPVQSGEQLPGGCWDFDGAGGHWKSPSNAAVFDLEAGGDGTHNDYVVLTLFRNGLATAHGGFIWSARADANNWILLRQFTDNNFEFHFLTGGVSRVKLLRPVSGNVMSTHAVALCWRTGTTFGFAMWNAASNDWTATTTTITAGDTFHASIKNQAGARFYIGHGDGSTASHRFNGSIGLVAAAVVPDGETLADYSLGTDLEKKLLMQDPQRLFSACGFSSSNVTAYGNWQNSSGTAKSTLSRANFAASDRCACPFTANYLEIQSAGAGDYAHAAYTMPAHPLPMKLNIGDHQPLTSPTCLELPSGDGWVASAAQWNQSNNPNYFLAFLGAAGTENRWPVNVPVAFFNVDSSSSNAKQTQYVAAGGADSFMGDTHTAMSILVADGKLICSPFMHSAVHSNTPAAGDTCFEAYQCWELTDDALPALKEPYTAWPWGTAYSGQDAYTEGTKTYSIWVTQDSQSRAVEVSRSRLSTSANIVATQYDYGTEAYTWTKISDGTGTYERAYPGPAVPLSDGRVLITGQMIHANGGGSPQPLVGYWGVIAPTKANWATAAEWKAFDGTALDGASGRPLLGSITIHDTPSIFITSENIAYIQTPPMPTGAGAAVLEVLPNLTTGIAHVDSPSWEGIAVIVRVSENNGDHNRQTTNSSGGNLLPWDHTYLRRYTYSGGAFTFRDEWDITSIIDAESEAGDWPQDTNYDTARVQYIHATQPAANQLLLYLVDPQGVALAANKSIREDIEGYRVRALLVPNLVGPDPTHYVELGSEIVSVPTDNTQGVALYPVLVGQGNYEQSLLAVGASGQWSTLAGGVVRKAAKWNTQYGEATGSPPTQSKLLHARGLVR